MGSGVAEDLERRIEETEVVELCSELVQFPTIDPPGNEQEAAEYVGAFLGGLGLDVELIAHGPQRASVLARLKGTGASPALIYGGHLDTVSAGKEPWAHEPFAGEVSQGKVWGRGSTDMKGGVAAMLSVARILVEGRVPLKGDLLLMFTAGEENGFTGARDIAARCDLGPVQAIFLSEPSDNGVVIAEKGILWLKISTHGRTAHIAQIDQGRNAISMMLPILTELGSAAFPYRPHALLGDFARSINTVHAGRETNTIPDLCEATVDLRTVPGQDHSEVIDSVRSLIERVREQSQVLDFSAELEVLLDGGPLENAPDDPTIVRFCDVVEQVTGDRPVPTGVGAATDAVELVPKLGVPFLMCGPGNPKLVHHTDEHVEIAKLVECTRIYLHAAVEFLT